MRLFGLAVTLLCIFGVYFNWQSALNERQFWVKLAFLAPMGVAFGLFIMIFPHLSGKPEDGKVRLEVWIMLALGTAAGFVNWYLLNGGF